MRKGKKRKTEEEAEAERTRVKQDRSYWTDRADMEFPQWRAADDKAWYDKLLAMDPHQTNFDLYVKRCPQACLRRMAHKLMSSWIVSPPQNPGPTVWNEFERGSPYVRAQIAWGFKRIDAQQRGVPLSWDKKVAEVNWPEAQIIDEVKRSYTTPAYTKKKVESSGPAAQSQQTLDYLAIDSFPWAGRQGSPRHNLSNPAEAGSLEGSGDRDRQRGGPSLHNPCQSPRSAYSTRGDQEVAGADLLHEFFHPSVQDQEDDRDDLAGTRSQEMAHFRSRSERTSRRSVGEFRSNRERLAWSRGKGSRLEVARGKGGVHHVQRGYRSKRNQSLPIFAKQQAMSARHHYIGDGCLIHHSASRREHQSMHRALGMMQNQMFKKKKQSRMRSRGKKDKRHRAGGLREYTLHLFSCRFVALSRHRERRCSYR